MFAMRVTVRWEKMQIESVAGSEQEVTRVGKLQENCKSMAFY